MGRRSAALSKCSGGGGKQWRGNEDGEGSRSEPDRVSQCLAREGERPVTGK